MKNPQNILLFLSIFTTCLSAKASSEESKSITNTTSQPYENMHNYSNVPLRKEYLDALIYDLKNNDPDKLELINEAIKTKTIEEFLKVRELPEDLKHVIPGNHYCRQQPQYLNGKVVQVIDPINEKKFTNMLAVSDDKF